MALPTISDIARVTADSEIRYTQSGKAVTQTRLAFNKAKWNEQTREWENDKTFFIDGTTWEDAAVRASDQLKKGVEVFVTGDLETQQWEKDGDKRSKPALTIRRFKVIPKSEQQPQQGYGQQPLQNDPWAGGGAAPNSQYPPQGNAPQGGGYGGQPQGAPQGAPANDPWAGGQPAPQGGYQDGPPPF